MLMKDPAAYHAWYETPRGAWIGAREADLMLELMLELMQPNRDECLLDVGCGTGWFSARFASVDLGVTGLDPDRAALNFAARRYPSIRWVEGRGKRGGRLHRTHRWSPRCRPWTPHRS